MLSPNSAIETIPTDGIDLGRITGRLRECDDTDRAHRRGVRFFFVAILSAIAGILHRELTTGIVGAVVLSVVIAMWGFTALRRVCLRKAQIELVADPRRVHTSGTVSVLCRFPPLPAGVLSIDLATPVDPGGRGRRTTTAPHRVSGKTRSAEIVIPDLQRGVYVPTSVTFLSYDPLGLSRLRVVGHSSIETFRVLPSAKHIESIHAGRGTAIRDLRGTSTKRRDEQIEARPYYPGDDPHRIHWGMLAHTGELFLRVGEEVPPPSKDSGVALDLTGAETMKEVDRLVSLALGIAVDLHRYGGSPTLVLFQPEPVWYSSIDDAREDWARLEPWCPGEPITPPGDRGARPIDLYVTTGRSSLAPPLWGTEAIGVLRRRDDGGFDAIATY